MLASCFVTKIYEETILEIENKSMLINEKTINYGHIGPRATIGLAINELAKNHDDQSEIACDVSASMVWIN